MAKREAPAIGIDLGTTNSCVAVIRDGRVNVIPNDMGHRSTPSYVAFTDEERLVGDAAKAQANLNPVNTIFDAKRIIGRQFTDPEIQKRLKFWPFQVLNASGNPKFRVTYKGEVKELTPEEISAMVLSKMKAVAETYIGAPVKDAVITVPAYFNDSQRQATLDASKIAGLNVLKLLNEPTAAAIAYGLDRKVKSELNVLVFDFRERSFDVTILSLSANNFDVLAVDGDTCLGGGDLDECLVEHFLQEIRTKHGKDLSGNSKAIGKLRNACERAKRNLSSSKEEQILVESLLDGNDFKSSLTRSRLNELCSEHFKNTMKPVDFVLRSANMDLHDIDEIILAGGSTRIPKIQELLREKFNNRELNQAINPDEAVAYGAAIHAANLCGEKSVEDAHLVDVTPLSLGIKVLGNVTSRITPRNTKLPAKKTKRFQPVTMAESEATAIGIDLGTTNSCVAVVRNGRVEIIANDMGPRITPSYVAFTEDERLIGDAAKAQATMNPENTIFDAKRFIGRQFTDPEIQTKLKFWPFKVLNASGNSKFRITYKGEVKEHTPEEISAMVLGKMKDVAETYIGAPVKDAVITVPAYFNDSQRQATLDAGKIAGLNVLKLLNEPTAAAIAYGFDQKLKAQQNVLVFDLGGGTFDVAILSLSANNFDVLAVDGDTCLGGGDLDECLVEHFLQEIRTKHGKDLSGNPKALGKLRKACERAKRNLSSSKKEPILVESLLDGNDFKSSLTRSRLNELCSEHFKNTMKPVDAVLRTAKMDIDDIDEVILAGGSTRIPKIQELLKEKFKNRQLNQTINPDEAVAYGAAIHAANLCGEKSVEDVHLVDVTPLSLGINVLGNVTSKIIPRNAKLPAKKTKRYVTTVDYQTGVDIKVYEGERVSSDDNRLLGEFSLENIQPAKKGIPQIVVTFGIDKNGILTVSAIDESTGNDEQLVIRTNKGRLNKKDIDRMIVEANEYHEDDKNREILDALRHELETLCVELRNLTEEGGREDDDNFQELQGVVDDTEEWLYEVEDADVGEYRSRYDALLKLKESVLGN